MKTTPEYRSYIGNISQTLAQIHKMLLLTEFEKYEKNNALTLSPHARLNLLLNAPEFAWLRDLSQMMASVDEIYFQKEVITETQISLIKKCVHDLMLVQNDSAFSKNYIGHLSDIPDLMLVHGQLKQFLKADI